MKKTISFGTGAFRKKAAYVGSAYPPLKATDMEHEGIFGQYYFDTDSRVVHAPGSAASEADPVKEGKMFWVKPSYGICRDPVSNELQEWLALGLHCKYDGDGCKKYGRPPVNLVVVMDVSGSMGGRFSGGRLGEGDRDDKTKMQVANESLVSMLRHLGESDSFGLVKFDHRAEIVCPLQSWKTTDAESVKRAVMALRPDGATDMSLGYATAAAMLADAERTEVEVKGTKYKTQNRILFFTDARPNAGETKPDGMFGMAKTLSERGIYSTFVGIGMDFGSELVSHITSDMKGAHYLTVESSAEFAEIMDENFDYTVFPTVFDFELSLSSTSGDVAIDQSYGTHESDQTTDSLMKAKTIFPGAVNESGHAKGCVILLKLKRTGAGGEAIRAQLRKFEKSGAEGGEAGAAGASEDAKEADSDAAAASEGCTVSLAMKYEDAISGAQEKIELEVDVPNPCVVFADYLRDKQEYFESEAVHKSIVLTHYLNLARALVSDIPITEESGIPLTIKDKDKAGAKKVEDDDDDDVLITGDSETPTKKDDAAEAAKRERKKAAAKAEGERCESRIALLENFKAYFAARAEDLSDELMKRELKVLDDLIKWQLEKKKLEARRIELLDKEASEGDDGAPSTAGVTAMGDAGLLGYIS